MAPQPPSLLEKILIIPLFAKIIVSALSRIILRPLTGGKKAPSLFRDIAYAAVRTNLSSSSIKQEQWIAPSTETEYLNLAKASGFQPDTTVLGSGNVKLHWLGSKTSEHTLLYFHGGGYVLPAMDALVKWLFELQQALKKKGMDITVVLVSYTLAPESQYPNQLREAEEALEHLLGKEGKDPGKIVVGGDSAGGNMTLLLLSHLLHPHPAIASKALSKMSSPLAGALLVSPWSKFGIDDDSVKRNARTDIVTTEAALRWSAAFLGSSPADAYNEPAVHAKSDWFKGLDSKVKEVMVWAGDAEILFDSIEVVTKKLKDAHPSVEYAVQEGGAHEQFIVDTKLGYKEKSEGTVAIEKWLQQVLA